MAPPARTAHRCDAPGCSAWACFGFGPPLWGFPSLRWLCFEHRDLAEDQLRLAQRHTERRTEAQPAPQPRPRPQLEDAQQGVLF